MTQRTTGATPEQVSSAAMRCFKNPNLTQHDYAEYAEWAMERTMDVASALVRPDERIVSVADLQTVLWVATSFRQEYKDHVQAAIDRITALIGDDA